MFPFSIVLFLVALTNILYSYLICVKKKASKYRENRLAGSGKALNKERSYGCQLKPLVKGVCSHGGSKREY